MYPAASNDVYESLAVDKFADDLLDSQTQQAIKLAQPQTKQALAQSLDYEAVKQSARGHGRVRTVEGHEVEDQLTGKDDTNSLIARRPGDHRDGVRIVEE